MKYSDIQTVMEIFWRHVKTLSEGKNISQLLYVTSMKVFISYCLFISYINKYK